MKSRIFNKLLLLFILSFVFIGFCYADEEDELSNKCLLEDRVRLQELASKIKVTYENAEDICAHDIDTDEESCDPSTIPNDSQIVFTRYYLKLKIYNMTDDFVIYITDGNNKMAVMPSDLDEDGVATVDIKNVTNVRNIVVNIKGRKAPCNQNSLKTVNITIPKYNYYSLSSSCDDLADYYVCQRYITFDMDYSYFQKHIEEYKEKISQMKDSSISLDDNNSTGSKLASLLANNKYIVLIVLLVLGVCVALFAIKWKERRKNEKKI